ncbi:MAG: hypothetical protein ACI4RC_03740 [Oscillospiraceae bacterium]
MFQLLAAANEGLQNVYTPFPMKAHFIICIITTLLYLVLYYRKHCAYYLLIMLGIDLTFITQIWTTAPVIVGLLIVEVAIIVAAFISLSKYNKKTKLKQAEQLKAEKEMQKAQKAAEKAQTAEDKKIIDNAFEEDSK